MKNLTKTFVFVLALAVMLAATPVTAEAATTVPTDVDFPSAGCTFLGIEGKYIAQIPEALERINEIRQEACQEGVINPSNGQPLTMADYVPIKWSSDLEYIARIRAAESCLTLNHTRTNGRSCFSIKGPNSVESFGEVLAWNYSENMTDGINQWYSEKSDWVNQKPNAVTLHYTMMINPKNLYVGLGTFCPKTVLSYNTTAGEYSDYTGLDEAQGTGIDDCIQILEVDNTYLNDNYTISGSSSGKKGDCVQLKLTTGITVENYWGDSTTLNGLLIMNPVTWTSSNPDVASVDANGVVTANLCGRTEITAKDSFGRIGTITFEVKQETIPETSKINPIITASDITKTSSVKAQTFSIDAKQSGSGKMTYSSNNKSVKVSSNGKVTVKAKFVGRATITIKTTENDTYNAATKEITLTVNPLKTTLSRVINVKRNKLTVKWKKNTMGSGYQIQYSTSKTFASGSKTVNVAKSSATSKTIGGLKKGKTYYVRIRTCKTVSGEKYYSKWGNAKKIKIIK